MKKVLVFLKICVGEMAKARHLNFSNRKFVKASSLKCGNTRNKIQLNEWIADVAVRVRSDSRS